MSSEQSDLYKLLDIESISDIIADRFPHLGISSSDLKVPTQDLVTKIFDAYLETFGIVVPVVVNNDKMPPNAYPEAFSEILAVSNLHHILNIILKANSFDDFSFSDITHPNQQRTSTILAILNNFDTYCDKNTGDLQPELVDLEDRKVKYAALRNRKEEIRQELNQRAVNRAQRETIKKNNEYSSKQKLITLEQLGAKQKIQLELEYKYNSRLQETKQRTNIQIKKVHDADEKIALLKKKVVLDLENLVKEPELLKEQLDQKEEEKEIKNKCIQQKKAGLERYNFVVDTQQHQTKLLREIKLTQGLLVNRSISVNSQESELKRITEELQNGLETISKQLKESQHKQEQSLSLELKISTKETQLKKSLMVANEERDQVKTKLEEACGYCSDIDKQVTKLQNEFENILEAQSKVTQHAEKKKSDVLSMHETLFADMTGFLAAQSLNNLDITSSDSENENNDHENISK